MTDIRLTLQELKFLQEHGVSEDELLDASLMGPNEYESTMRSGRYRVAVNTPLCDTGKHSMRGVNGTCVVCDPKELVSTTPLSSDRYFDTQLEKVKEEIAEANKEEKTKSGFIKVVAIPYLVLFLVFFLNMGNVIEASSFWVLYILVPLFLIAAVVIRVLMSDIFEAWGAEIIKPLITLSIIVSSYFSIKLITALFQI